MPALTIKQTTKKKRRTVASRKHLQSVARNVAASFVSRNNRIEGYWAIGKLCSFAFANHTDRLTIDLLAGANGEVFPATTEFTLPIHLYQRMLATQLHHLQIAPAIVTRLVLTLLFNQPPQGHDRDFSAWGQPCLCLCELSDDLGKNYHSRIMTYCRPHDPARETRGVR